MSYNYGPAEAELYLCELSDKNHLQVSSDELKERHGFIYRPVTPVSKLKQRCQRSIYHKPVLHAYYILLIVKVIVIEAIVVILELIVIRIYLKSLHWTEAREPGSELMIKTLNNRPSSIYQYSNMTPRLSV